MATSLGWYIQTKSANFFVVSGHLGEMGTFSTGEVPLCGVFRLFSYLGRRKWLGSGRGLCLLGIFSELFLVDGNYTKMGCTSQSAPKKSRGFSPTLTHSHPPPFTRQPNDKEHSGATQFDRVLNSPVAVEMACGVALLLCWYRHLLHYRCHWPDRYTQLTPRILIEASFKIERLNFSRK